MDLSLGITVGASIQVALVVAPVLVFCGVLMGQRMDLTFSPFEVVAIALSVYVARNLIYDGESNWLEGSVQMYPGSIAFVRHVRGMGLKTAVVSSSHNCGGVLRAAGIDALFDAQVDGAVVDQLHLRGKPAPDSYLHASKLVGVPPVRAVVVEDALAGVQAGRAGGFGLVIGVDRGNGVDALQQNGAGIVVSDLAELLEAPAGGRAP